MEELGRSDLPVATGGLDEIAPFLAVPDAAEEGAGFDIGPVEAPTEVSVEAPAPAGADWDPAGRNQQLRAVSIEVGKLENIRRSNREPEKGLTQGSKTSRQERKASRSLEKACGKCALETNCEIAGNLRKWHSIHRDEFGRRLDRYGQESRARFLQRLKQDPQASCLPPKKRS